MPLQIKRLLIMFAIFIALFLLVRHFLIPDSFGKYGHYRGDALAENAAKEVKYAGTKSCIACHDTVFTLKKSGKHEVINCETCHGPGYKHNKTPKEAKLLIPNGRDFCIKCHGKNIAKRKENIVQIDPKEHNVEGNCTECHNPHQPWK
jgi:hypothetical protein